MARLTPEEVIRGYYEAVNRGDYVKAHAYESCRALSQYLFSNMDNNFLYNPGFRDGEADGLGNITSARVISIKRAEGAERGLGPGRREYAVNVDLQVKRTITHESGPQPRFIILSQETPVTGWRIEFMGTGP